MKVPMSVAVDNGTETAVWLVGVWMRGRARFAAGFEGSFGDAMTKVIAEKRTVSCL